MMIHRFVKFKLWEVLGNLIRVVATGLPISLYLIGLSPTPAFAASAEVAEEFSPVGSYLAGRHAQAEHDFDAAIEFLKVTLRTLPEIPDLLNRTFILMITEGRFEEALPYAERLIVNDPEAPFAHIVTLVSAFKNGDAADQEARLKVQPSTGLNGFIKPIFAAWSQASIGNIKAGLKTLEALDKTKAARQLYYLHKALILDFAGRTIDAEEAYTKLTKDRKVQNFRLIQIQGNFLERIGKTSEAAALYNQFSKTNPETMLLVPAYARLRTGTKPKPIIATANDGVAEALFNIFNSLGESQVQETAIIFCRLALWLKPKFPIAQTMVAEILDNNLRYAAANEIYSNIDHHSPFRFSADLRRARNLNALEQLDAAVTLLRGMANKFTSTPQPLIRLGSLMRRHKRWSEAIVAYTQAIDRVGSLTKRHWRMLYSRGIVFERAKRWPEAEKDFLRALEFEPEQPFVLNYLGYSWVERGVNLKRALEMIHTAVRRRPNDGYIIDSLGWVYYRLGNFRKAVAELERAVQIRPDDPIINDHLGDAYWRVDRKMEAKFQWKRALSLQPEAEVEADVRKKLEDGLLPWGPVGTPDNEAGENKNPDKT